MFHYLEVEDRPVVIVRQNEVVEVWVWNSTGWTYAPGLLGKTRVEGITLTEAEFRSQFAQAVLPVPAVTKLAGSTDKFLEFQIGKKIDQDILLEKLKEELPDFGWRAGCSDQGGPYIKAYPANNTDVAIWLGDCPHDLTIDARQSTLDAFHLQWLQSILITLVASLMSETNN